MTEEAVTTVPVDLGAPSKRPLTGVAAWTPEQRAEAQRKTAEKRAAKKARSDAAKARAEARKQGASPPTPPGTPPPKPEASDETLFESCGYLWGRLWGAVATVYDDERIATTELEDREAAPALAVGAKALGIDKFIVRRRY